MTQRFYGLFKYYILIFILSLITWFFIFDQLTKIKPTEEIRIFIAATSVKTEYTNTLVEQGLTLGLRHVDLVVVSPDHSMFSEMLLTKGLHESDLLILPQSILDSTSLDQQFVGLENAYLLDFGIDLTAFDLYTKNAINYGIKVFEEGHTDLLNSNVSYLDDGEVYYILINATRPNIGTYYINESAMTHNSFYMLGLLLNSE